MSLTGSGLSLTGSGLSLTGSGLSLTGSGLSLTGSDPREEKKTAVPDPTVKKDTDPDSTMVLLSDGSSEQVVSV